MKIKTEVSATVADQIKVGLDGRSQRWLAIRISMPEDVLSKKLKNIQVFTPEDIALISKHLKIKIKH